MLATVHDLKSALAHMIVKHFSWCTAEMQLLSRLLVLRALFAIIAPKGRSHTR
jgi:hypothetical protein